MKSEQRREPQQKYEPRRTQCPVEWNDARQPAQQEGAAGTGSAELLTVQVNHQKAAQHEEEVDAELTEPYQIVKPADDGMPHRLRPRNLRSCVGVTENDRAGRDAAKCLQSFDLSHEASCWWVRSLTPRRQGRTETPAPGILDTPAAGT